MMDEYRSPFKLPGQEKPPKCTSRKDAVTYPELHTRAGSPGASRIWGRACPVHSYQERAKKKLADPWLLWFTYREAYATTDGEEGEAARQEFMSKMLGTVTAANPPDVPFKPPARVKAKTGHDIGGRGYLIASACTVMWLIMVLCLTFT